MKTAKLCFLLILITALMSRFAPTSANPNQEDKTTADPYFTTLAYLKKLNKPRFDFLVVEDLHKMRHLNVFGMAVTDEGLKHLAVLTTLTNLNLGRTRISVEGLKELSPLTSLTSLGLRYLAVTGDGLKNLSALESLTTLDISYSEVTGKQLRALSEVSTLGTLVLWGKRVTDEDLIDLSSVTSLTTLNLRNSLITEAGLEEFKKVLPNCEVRMPRRKEPDEVITQADLNRPFKQGVGDQVVTKSITLTENILNCETNGLIISADNVVVDGGGHTISGLGKGNDITSKDGQNVTIRNCVIRGFQIGIFLASDVSARSQTT